MVHNENQTKTIQGNVDNPYVTYSKLAVIFLHYSDTI